MRDIKLGIVALILLVGASIDNAVSKEIPKLDIVSGYYTVSKAGHEPEPGSFAKHGTAEEAAVNLSFDCECMTLIHTPDIRITTGTTTKERWVATLDWEEVTLRDNGEPMSKDEIQHYVVEYWAEGAGVISIITGKVLTYIIGDLIPGQWHFRIATVDSNGKASNWSETISSSKVDL